MTDVGLVLATDDGQGWSVAGPPRVLPSDALVAMPGGLVSYSIDGATQVSADGFAWYQGPAAPQLDVSELEAAVTGTTGLVVIAWQPDGSRSWVVPMVALQSALQQAVPVASAPMPEVGVRYPLQLAAFCGGGSVRASFNGEVWTATFADVYAAGLGRQWDDGSVVMSDDSHAVYTTSRGDTIPLTAVHPPPTQASCF